MLLEKAMTQTLSHRFYGAETKKIFPVWVPGPGDFYSTVAQ